MARRLQADRPSHRPLAPAGDRLADRLGRKQQQRGSQHRHPLDRGHPVGGRAASTSSQVDEPEQRQELDGDHPHQQAIGCLAEDAQRRHGAATLKGRWPSGPARWRRTPSSTRWPAPAPRPAGHPRTPAEQQRRADRHHGQRDDRVHRAGEPDGASQDGPVQRASRPGPRWPLHHPRLGWLGAKGQRRQQVGTDVQGEDLQHRQGQGDLSGVNVPGNHTSRTATHEPGPSACGRPGSVSGWASGGRRGF